MKKKLLCLFSVFILVFALTACGGDTDSSKEEKSDFDAFMEVQNNMQGVDDIEFKMDMNMAVTGAEEIDMKMSGTGKEILKDKDNIQAEMKYKMSIPGLGSNVESTMYIKDKAVYMDSMGQKIKMDTSDEMASMMNIQTDQLLAITKDMVSNLSVSKDGSNTVYAFDMDAEKAIDYLKKNAGASQYLGELDEGVTFDKMKVSVTADENQMAQKIDMDCAMAMKADDETINMVYTVSIEYTDINSNLKIDFPDFSDYHELTV